MEKKNYKVVKGDKVLIKNVSADSMAEVALLVAKEFGDDYFGCNIIQNEPLSEEQIRNGWGKNFMCVAVKEYYQEGLGEVPNPVLIAAQSMVHHTREVNGFCKKTVDHRGTSFDFDIPIE